MNELRDTKLEIIGSKAFLAEQLERIDKIAATDDAVLITGETGVGKELVARNIHKRGNRADQPFTTLDCSAMPDNYFDLKPRKNENSAAFNFPSPGVLFMDDIGDLSPAAQTSLLKLMQKMASGGRGKQAPDMRIIVATNINLQVSVDLNKFRSDLYYRLCEITIHIKSLRERREDIALLAGHFMKIYSDRYGKDVAKLSDAALSFLKRYNFPGNVLELRNMIQNAVLFNDKDVIWLEDLPLEIVARNTATETPTELLSLKQVEKRHIMNVLDYSGWNVSRASRILGITRATLYDKIKQHNLEKK
jgi:DNA-binding NtrC family response regulator